MNYIVYHYPGSIKYKGVGNSLRYLDQLRYEETWLVGGKRLQMYLFDNYNLTVEQYYCQVVFGDYKFVPTCPIEGCNRKLVFYSLLSGYKKYCCLSHRNLDQWNNPKFVSKMRKCCSDVVHVTHPVTVRNAFINKYRGSKAIFYLSITNDKHVKIGITTSSIQDRILCGSRFDIKSYTIHSILHDNAEIVAELEYQIKLKLGSISEYFEFKYLNDILNIIREFKKGI